MRLRDVVEPKGSRSDLVQPLLKLSDLLLLFSFLVLQVVRVHLQAVNVFLDIVGVVLQWVDRREVSKTVVASRGLPYRRA